MVTTYLSLGAQALKQALLHSYFLQDFQTLSFLSRIIRNLSMFFPEKQTDRINE